MTYNFSTKEIFIPNYEISEHLASTIKIMDWSEVAKSLKCSEELLEATLNYDAEKVAWILEQCHNDNTSILQYNDENSLVCVISIAYYTDKISEYTGDILLVGINYDDEKGHTCEIEEIVKQ